MDFESIKQMLHSNDMEVAPAPQSNDIFNIFCKKDGDHISTIQVLEDEIESDYRAVLPLAHQLLERAVKAHRLKHPPNYQVSIYDDVAESAIKNKY
ncbi:hypothetical protein KA183_19070 [bacterium]|nr:hypothetical protein [bacterium]